MMATNTRTMFLTSQACGRDGALEQTEDFVVLNVAFYIELIN